MKSRLLMVDSINLGLFEIRYCYNPVVSNKILLPEALGQCTYYHNKKTGVVSRVKRIKNNRFNILYMSMLKMKRRNEK